MCNYDGGRQTQMQMQIPVRSLRSSQRVSTFQVNTDGPRVKRATGDNDVLARLDRVSGKGLESGPATRMRGSLRQHWEPGDWPACRVSTERILVSGDRTVDTGYSKSGWELRKRMPRPPRRLRSEPTQRLDGNMDGWMAS